MTALSALTETTSIADLDQIYVLDGANSRRVSWSNLKAQLKADTPLKNLFEDAVDVLSQRNGASDQAYHLYNTYTNASNYERLEFRWSAGNILEIATARAGTGSNRSIRVIAGGQTWEFSTAGTLGGPGPISLTGANGYAMFKDAADAYDFGPDLADVVAEYIAEQGDYQPYTDGRIMMK